MIVLDTSAVIEFTRGNSIVAEIVKTAENRGEKFAVTSVTLFELLTPIFHKGLTKKERVLRAFLHNVSVLQLDEAASEEAAKVMSGLLRIGRSVNVLDVLIAGISVTNGAELLICTDADFAEISKILPSLKIELLR